MEAVCEGCTIARELVASPLNQNQKLNMFNSLRIRHTVFRDAQYAYSSRFREFVFINPEYPNMVLHKDLRWPSSSLLDPLPFCATAIYPR